MIKISNIFLFSTEGKKTGQVWDDMSNFLLNNYPYNAVQTEEYKTPSSYIAAPFF